MVSKFQQQLIVLFHNMGTMACDQLKQQLVKTSLTSYPGSTRDHKFFLGNLGCMVIIINASLTSYPGCTCDHKFFLIRNLGCMVIIIIFVVNVSLTSYPGS